MPVNEFTVGRQRIRVLTNLRDIRDGLALRFQGIPTTELPASEIRLFGDVTAEAYWEVTSPYRVILARGRDELDFVVKDLHLDRMLRAHVGGFNDAASRRETALLDMLQCLIEIGVIHALASGQQDLRFIHAGAVAKSGRAILLLGGSGCGKTTLALGLAMQGFDLVSDDTTCIDLKQRLVYPYPRTPRIREGSRMLLQELQFQRKAWNLPRIASSAATISNIVFLNRPSSPPRIELVAPDEALWLFLDYLLNRAHQPISIRLSQNRQQSALPEELMQAAALIDSVRCYKISPGDLRETRALIEREFEWTGSEGAREC